MQTKTTLKNLVFVYLILGISVFILSFFSKAFSADYPTLPYTFEARQLIQANKVMANYEALLNGYTDGLKKINVNELWINGSRLINSTGNIITSGNISGASFTDGVATLTGGALSGLTNLTIDNLNINGNTISSVSGNIYIEPLAGRKVIIDTFFRFDFNQLDFGYAGYDMEIYPGVRSVKIICNPTSSILADALVLKNVDSTPNAGASLILSGYYEAAKLIGRTVDASSSTDGLFELYINNFTSGGYVKTFSSAANKTSTFYGNLTVTGNSTFDGNLSVAGANGISLTNTNGSYLKFIGANNYLIGRLETYDSNDFYIDSTFGSMIFRTGTGGTTSPTTRLTIEADGSVNATTAGASFSAVNPTNNGVTYVGKRGKTSNVFDNGSFTFNINGAGLFVIYNDEGYDALFYAGYNSSTILKISDQDNRFEVTNTDTGKTAVYKSAESTTITVKNYTNATKTYSVNVFGVVISATAPI